MGAMFGFTGWDLLGWVIFSGISVIALAWGKMKDRWQPMVIGVVMGLYPYLINKGILLWVVGLALTVALFYAKD